jgi:hypothetical protein
MSRRLLTVTAGAALALAAACGGDNANNTNNANRNANVTVTTTPTPSPTPAGSAYNRNYNSRADFDRDNANYRAEAKNAGTSVGQGVEDGWIHFKTRAALAAADDLRDSTINVDVDNNVVTLRGSVANAAQKASAGKVAQGIEGVKSVKNQLTVSADGGSNSNNANTRKG